MKKFLVIACAVILSQYLIAQDGLPNLQTYSETADQYIERNCHFDSAVEHQECLKGTLSQVDYELNRVMKKIISSLSKGGKAAIEEARLLQGEQQAWQVLREMKADSARQAASGGSVSPTIELLSLIGSGEERASELRQRHHALFGGEPTLDDLVGTWKGLVGTQGVLTVEPSGTCKWRSRENAKEVAGVCRRETSRLLIQSANGSTLFDQWIAIEPFMLGQVRRLSLGFLAGEGKPREILLEN